MKLSSMNCHYRFFDIDTYFKEISKLGFDACEIWTSPHHFLIDYQGYESIDKLNSLADQYHIKIIGICPEQTNPKPHNIATGNQMLKERVYQYFCNCIDVASGVGSNQLVITSGWAFLNEDKNESYDRSVVMMKRIASYASSKGVSLALEALQPDESTLVNTIKDIQLYREAVGSSSLKVCIDMGAMARMDETLEAYFTTFGKDIIHIHFVDGKPTGHLAWGDGNRSIKNDLEVIQKYGYTGYLSLENATSRYYMDPFAADKQSIKYYEMAGGK